MQTHQLKGRMASTLDEITYTLEFSETVQATRLEIRRYNSPYLPKPIFCIYRATQGYPETIEPVATLRAGQKQLRKWRIQALVGTP